MGNLEPAAAAAPMCDDLLAPCLDADQAASYASPSLHEAAPTFHENFIARNADFTSS